MRSKGQTITRAFLPRNQSPSESNSQRGRSCEQTFDSSTTFLNPWSERTHCMKNGQSAFFLSPHTPVRLVRHALPIFLLILRKKPTVLQSKYYQRDRCFFFFQTTLLRFLLTT